LTESAVKEKEAHDDRNDEMRLIWNKLRIRTILSLLRSPKPSLP
jgi:hypothetical protein